tara:strand:+ start:854 stop:1015 length:162 start_codon:yes stop_codon:yes gene_type:complete
MDLFTSAYFIGMATTGGVVYASNRATGMPWKYFLAASLGWPVWWLLMSLGDYT